MTNKKVKVVIIAGILATVMTLCPAIKAFADSFFVNGEEFILVDDILAENATATTEAYEETTTQAPDEIGFIEGETEDEIPDDEIEWIEETTECIEVETEPEVDTTIIDCNGNKVEEKGDVRFIDTKLIDYSCELENAEYEIPDGITEIGVAAIANNAYLKTVHIPESVTEIGAIAFEGTDIETVVFAGSPSQWRDMVSDNATIGLSENTEIIFLKEDETDVVTEIESIIETTTEEVTTEEVTTAETTIEEITTEVQTTEILNDGILGDTDGDGRITAFDARLALRHSADLIILEEAAVKLADMNGDGLVRASDARTILRKAAGL